MSVLLPRRSRAGLKVADSRGTPPELYAALDAEFHFDLDPCPLDTTSTAGAPLWGKDGLRASWAGRRVFCNPPYSEIDPWLEKSPEAALAVFLLPARTDSRWWQVWAMAANEVRFIRGRLHFQGPSGGAPFASVVLVLVAGPHGPTRWRSMERPPRPALARKRRGAPTTQTEPEGT